MSTTHIGRRIGPLAAVAAAVAIAGTIETFGLLKLLGEGKKPEEQMPFAIVALIGGAMSLTVYSLQATYGRRRGYVSIAFPDAEKRAQDRLNERLASQKYKHLHQTLLVLHDSPERIKAKEVQLKALKDRLKNRETEWGNRTQEIQNDQRAIVRDAAPDMAAWPPEESQLYLDTLDDLEHEQEHLRSLVIAEQSMKEDGP